MFQIDLTQPEASITQNPDDFNRILVKSSLQESLIGELFRVQGNDRLVRVPQKEGSVYDLAPRGFYIRKGRFRACSFPNGKIGNAFVLDFEIKSKDRKTLSLYMKVNERMVFWMLGRGAIVLFPGRAACLDFSDGDVTEKYGFPRTRFDRLDTLEVGS